VITSPLTFSATANMALALGARPVFADVLESTLCLDPEAVERALTPRTKLIAPVDFAGNPADMDRFSALAERHGLWLVEDAAHSVGGSYRGRPVGSLAHLTTFSFHPVKTITTGEGGAVLTSDDKLAQRARDFRNHGLVRDRARLGQSDQPDQPGQPAQSGQPARYDGPWYYEIQSLGFNYRLSDIHAALGRSQLAKLERFVARRRALVARYREGLVGCPRLRLVEETPGVEPAWHLMTVVLEGSEALRREVYAHLEQKRIRPQVHYILVSDFPLYRRLGYDPQTTPVAARAAERLLSLPLFPSLTDGDVDRVIAALREVLG
jgi:perosamine synthetase